MSPCLDILEYNLRLRFLACLLYTSRTALGLAVVAAAIVLSNVMITVRIPSVVEQVGHGTAQTAGVILAAMQFVGILAGLAFSPLTQLFRDRLLVISGVAYGLTQQIGRAHV